MKRVSVVTLMLALLAPSGSRAASDAHLRGLLDMSLSSSNQGRALNLLTFDDSNYDPYRLRLFLDTQLAPGLEVHVQTLLHEGSGGIRADGAYVLWTPWPRRDVSLEAGKIPWPIGTYAPRTYSNVNALIGTPLMYQYRTALRWDEVTVTTDDLVAGAGQGQLNRDVKYLPIIDERWWDTGAAVVGSLRPLEYSLGVTLGSPSWPSPGQDDTPGQTVLGRVGLVPVAGVRVGVSAADGTYLPGWFAPSAPAERPLRQYRERTTMADAEVSRGAFEVRGEGFERQWDTLTLGTLGVRGGYAEARWGLNSGAWLAARGETLRFSTVTTSSLVTRPWDDRVTRWEGVLGYRVTRDVRVKLGAQRMLRFPFAAARKRTDLLSASLSLRF